MSPGVMRPCAVTAVASTKTSPAPPTARLPRWTRCQSSANPSTEEYWHIGETTMRLRSVTPRIMQGDSRDHVDLRRMDDRKARRGLLLESSFRAPRADSSSPAQTSDRARSPDRTQPALRNIALPEQQLAQSVARLRIIRIRGDHLRNRSEGFVELARLDQRPRQIVTGVLIIRPKFQRQPELVDRLASSAPPLQTPIPACCRASGFAGVVPARPSEIPRARPAHPDEPTESRPDADAPTHRPDIFRGVWRISASCSSEPPIA